MLSRRLPFRTPFDQPIFAHVLVCLGTALSLWWALQFCNLRLPDEPLWARAAAAVTWEGARLYLTPLAVLLLVGDVRENRTIPTIALLPLVVVLTAGSVAASVAALELAEMRDQQRIRDASPVYQDALVQRDVLDAQLEQALKGQEGYGSREMWAKAAALGTNIAALRVERARVAALLAKLQAGAPVAVADAGGVALGADAQPPRPNADAAPDAVAHPASAQPAVPRTWLRFVAILALKLIAPAVRIAVRMQRRCATDIPAPNSAHPVPSTPVIGAAPARSRRTEEYATSYAEVKAAVLSGDAEVSTRGIQRAAKVGQARAQQIQKDLLTDGVIVRAGQG